MSGMNGAELLCFLLPVTTCRVSSQFLWQAWQRVVLSAVLFHRELAHCTILGGVCGIMNIEYSQVHQSVGD